MPSRRRNAATIAAAQNIFIHECPLVKESRTATHLNQKEGMALEKGAQAPQVKVAKPKVPQEMPKAYGIAHRLPS